MTEQQRLEAAEWILSAEGQKRFRGWELTFLKHPLAGIAADAFASKMV
jgi:hypothetical protein